MLKIQMHSISITNMTYQMYKQRLLEITIGDDDNNKDNNAHAEI